MRHGVVLDACQSACALPRVLLAATLEDFLCEVVRGLQATFAKVVSGRARKCAISWNRAQKAALASMFSNAMSGLLDSLCGGASNKKPSSQKQAVLKKAAQREVRVNR